MHQVMTVFEFVRGRISNSSVAVFKFARFRLCIQDCLALGFSQKKSTAEAVLKVHKEWWGQHDYSSKG